MNKYLNLYLDFCNIIFKIKHKLYTSSVSSPPPLKILGARPCRMYSQQRGEAPKCTSDVRKFHLQNVHKQGYTNPGRQFATATSCCTSVPNVGGSTTWNWLYVSLLTTRTLKRLLEICTICAPCTKLTIQQHASTKFCTCTSEYVMKPADWRQQCIHTHLRCQSQ